MILEIILAVSAGTALVAVLAACVCGCRKDTHKSELVGTAGIVKLRFEEEIPHPSQNSPVPSKRVSSQNSHRSLPEIPPSLPVQDSGDTASDLYATVGIAEQRTSGRNSPTVNGQSSQSREHEYARLQNGLGINEPNLENEKLVGNSSSSLPLLSGISNDSPQTSETPVLITASNAISGQVSSSRELPYMTPPVISTATVSTENDDQIVVHQSNQHFSGDSVDSTKGYTSITVREPLSFIRPNIPVNLRGSQPHYTTVSDDSDEMYAAIEEPTNQVYTSESETYAQIQPLNAQPQNAAVVEVSTSTSSNPPPANSITPNAASCNISNQISEGAQSNLKRTNQDISNNSNIQKHTRQASNSSHPDSVGALGSPKPEKRQANSPLPPPPPSISDTVSSVNVAHKKTQDSPSHHKKSSKHHKISSTGNLHENEKLRRSLNEKHQRNNSCVSSSDFYGCNYPVDKHRFSSGDLVRPLAARELNFSLDKPEQKSTDAIYNTIDGSNDIYAAIDQEPSRNSVTPSQPNVTNSPIKNVEEMYAKVIKKSKHSMVDHHSQPTTRLSNYDDLNSGKPEYNANIQPSRKKGTQDIEKRYSGSNIVSLTQENNSKNVPGRILSVQLLEKDDPGYETIDKSKSKSHGYETISKNKTAKAVDPGYETVKELNKNVENKKSKIIQTVSGGLMQHSHNSIDIMQRITLHDGRTDTINEPGYESVPSGPDSLLSNDPGYEHIHRHEKYASDSDPNYEQLRLRNTTPPYASIRNRPQNNVPGYSVINKVNKSSDQNWSSNNNDNFLSEPNYESMPHEPAYNTGSESDPNYESVGPKDPNYESVKYFNVSTKEPPYEKVKNDTNSSGDTSQFQRSNSSSSYEKIKPMHKHDKSNDDNNDNRRNGSSLSFVAENGSVADYFQV